MTQRLHAELTFEENVSIEGMGLRHVLYMPEIRKNTRLLTNIAERWHSETYMFQLSIGTMFVTLEDAYRILWVLIHGDIIVNDREGDRDEL